MAKDKRLMSISIYFHSVNCEYFEIDVRNNPIFRLSGALLSKHNNNSFSECTFSLMGIPPLIQTIWASSKKIMEIAIFSDSVGLCVCISLNPLKMDK